MADGQMVEHDDDQDQPARALTWWNIMRAVLLYFLDLLLVIVLLPRGSNINLRNLLLIVGKFGVHFAMLSFTYAMYLAIISNSDLRPHGPVSMGINRILGLPADLQCRSRRDLNEEWSLLQLDNNATTPGSTLSFGNNSTLAITAPVLEDKIEGTSLDFFPTTDVQQAPMFSTTPPSQVTSTSQTLPNLSSEASSVANQTDVSSSNFTLPERLKVINLQSSTTEPTTPSSSNFSPTAIPASSPAAVTTQQLADNVSAPNLTSSTGPTSLNSSSQADDEVLELLDKIIGIFAMILLILTFGLACCFTALAFAKWREERNKAKARRTISQPMRPVQQVFPNRDSAFQPATSLVFQPIETSTFRPIETSSL